ncbi:MAG: hypothetical protein WAY02_08425 [Burkholderiaceae bacterium]
MHEYMPDQGGASGGLAGAHEINNRPIRGKENQSEKQAGIKSKRATPPLGHVRRNAGHDAGISGHVHRNTHQWQKCHELRENKLALVHCGPLRAGAKDHKSWNRSSNRDQTEVVKSQGKSLTYEALM